MHTEIRAHFQALVSAVQRTSVHSERKEVVARSVGRLSALYLKLGETNESRYVEEITAVVQAVLEELEACPEARKLETAFQARLRLLHEELGVPILALQSTPKPLSPNKTRTKR